LFRGKERPKSKENAQDWAQEKSFLQEAHHHIVYMYVVAHCLSETPAIFNDSPPRVNVSVQRKSPFWGLEEAISTMASILKKN